MFKNAPMCPYKNVLVINNNIHTTVQKFMASEFFYLLFMQGLNRKILFKINAGLLNFFYSSKNPEKNAS